MMINEIIDLARRVGLEKSKPNSWANSWLP